MQILCFILLLTLVFTLPSYAQVDVYLNAGGSDYTDTNGDLFEADKAYTAGDFGYSGGSTRLTTRDVTGTEDDPLYQSIREGASFSYLYDVSNGDYQVTLYLMEPQAQQAARRTFDVTAEGTVMLDDYDIYAAAGYFTAHSVTFNVTVNDGQLNLDFDQVQSGPGLALVCGIVLNSLGAPVPEPDIDLSVTSVDFGQVVVDDFADIFITIYNVGDDSLTISDMATTNARFAALGVAPPFDLAAGDSQDVRLRFGPIAEGVLNADLNIDSNDPDEATVVVTLTGEGVSDTPPPPLAEYLINAGGSLFTDSDGETFEADKEYVSGDFGYSGGSTRSTSADVLGTTDDPLYQSIREGASFSYIFDLADGDYQITCYFVEPQAQQAGRRIFDVSAEGNVVLDDFDIYNVAGFFTAHSESFPVTVTDGQLNLDFAQVSGPGLPMVCAIAVGDSAGAPPPPDACNDSLLVWDPVTETCIATFTDVTDILGVGDRDHRHFGIAIVDVNNDGWVDLYYPNGSENPDVPVPPSGTCPDLSGGPPTFPTENVNVFYLNNGDGTFGPDIAEEVGLDDYWNAMRHVWADYDNDGRRDLLSHNFLTSNLYHAISGPDPLQYENASAQSGLEICLTGGASAAWADLNNDGFLDVYACEYSALKPAEDMVNVMYQNNGNGTFFDITATAGVNLPDNPMGVAFADYDNDGDQDLFITNSHDPPFGAPSRLYRNDSLDVNGVPHFTDIAAEAGVDIVGGAGRGFGVAWGDYDNDGKIDLLYLRETDSRLFHNEGPDVNGVWTFSDVTGLSGLDIAGQLFHSGNFADLNNDGWLDILLANASSGEINSVFLNDNGNTWHDIGELVGMDLLGHNTKGVVPADTDNDGDLDVLWFVRGTDEANYLFRNELLGSNWIHFRLTGTISNRDAVGARIQITSNSGLTQIREVAAGTGFFDDIPRIQYFGLGSATSVTNVTVTWPSGMVQNMGSMAMNQRHDITEPASRQKTFVQKEIGDQAIISDKIKIPNTMFIEQNYPNPFNPTTSIRYGLNHDSWVTLKIYNTLGQEVVTLVDAFQNSGYKSVVWDGRDKTSQLVSSGIYIYKLQAGSFSQTYKMIFSK